MSEQMEQEDVNAEGERVYLHVYDLSVGLATHISPLLLGKQIEAIWHTGLVVYGIEYYFGNGISAEIAGQTPFGSPKQVIELGKTYIGKHLVRQVVQEMSHEYTPQSYSLFHHNCNNFSNALSNTLLGKGIPSNILNLPTEVLNSPFGQLFGPIFNELEQQLRSVGGDQFRQPASEPTPQNETNANEASANHSTPETHESTTDQGQGAKSEKANEFSRLVEMEFTKLMENGALNAQEAAIQAMSIAKACFENT